jgi:hypothetical protein
MWHVTAAAGEPADTVLRLSVGDGGGLILFRHCGDFSGDWQTSVGGAFLGSLDGFSQACLNTVNEHEITPPWLANSRAFRVRGAERDLVAADGTVTARLLPAKQASNASPDLIQYLRQPPTLSPSAIQKLRQVPPALPAGAISAQTATLLGTWVPYPIRQYRNDKKPSVTFRRDGNWSSSDGCNGTYGAWTLDRDGVLVTTAGPSTAIGCDGAPTGSWVIDAPRLAVSGNVLTLYDISGRMVARLTR